MNWFNPDAESGAVAVARVESAGVRRIVESETVPLPPVAEMWMPLPPGHPAIVPPVAANGEEVAPDEDGAPVVL